MFVISVLIQARGRLKWRCPGQPPGSVLTVYLVETAFGDSPASTSCLLVGAHWHYRPTCYSVWLLLGFWGSEPRSSCSCGKVLYPLSRISNPHPTTFSDRISLCSPAVSSLLSSCPSHPSPRITDLLHDTDLCISVGHLLEFNQDRVPDP